VHAQYTVLVEARSEVQQRLQAAGIPTAVHYPVPVHLQPAYAHLDPGAVCPVACALADTVLSLPMGPYLGDANIERVCAALLDALAALGETAATGAPDPSAAMAAATAPTASVSV
jgi:UDP-2-acetamido-2-deoxy-ribo-hexuluronate aminotransferase